MNDSQRHVSSSVLFPLSPARPFMKNMNSLNSNFRAWMPYWSVHHMVLCLHSFLLLRQKNSFKPKPSLKNMQIMILKHLRLNLLEGGK